jgi:hypothetical protein
MTYSLNIRNGDLNLGGPKGVATVTGVEKLLQDLRQRLLEPVGTDPMNPDFGSSLDGGISVDGVEIITNIGGQFTGETKANIEAEILRCLQAHQQMQAARIRQQQDRYGGKTFFTEREILYRIDSIDSQQMVDTLVVKVVMTTAAGTQFSIVQPLGSF